MLGSEELAAARRSFALGPVLGAAGAVTSLLLAMAGRYGYHRDELYFLAAGHHLAWGYPDQPPLVPALARFISHFASGSVLALRVPSAVAAGALVVLAAACAYELGGSRPAQLLATAGMATAGVLFGVGHLLSTATFYVLVTAVLMWLILRVLRSGDQRLWLLVGVIAGVGLLDSDLIAFVMAAVVIGLLVSGPRQVFRSPWIWIGGAVALAMWAPYLDWQARHSWPELAVSRSIAAGNSGTSQPRSLLLPEQLVLVSPYFAAVWLTGLVRLFRDPVLRGCRWIGAGWVLLALVFLVTGGKSYYLAGMFPVLLGAGAQPVVDWMACRPAVGRSLGAGIAVSAVFAVVVTLPLVPVTVLHDTRSWR